MLKKHWWKLIPIVCMPPLIYFSFMGKISVQNNLHETMRNLYFHVTMWFSMFILFTISVVNSIIFLSNGKNKFDRNANITVQVGLIYGTVGMITGSIWANYTWGKPWVIEDPQLNSAAITVLAYISYLILRNSIKDEINKAKVSAVYNIFSFVLMFVLIGILPRINDSLHPGKGGNPGFGSYDLASGMRPIFYGSILVWTLIGVWIFRIKVKLHEIKQKTNSF